MTEWEQRIAAAFIEKYPRSAAASGGRPLRLSRKQLFPGFEKSSPDARESFLDAAETLAKRGVLCLVWARRKKRETLTAAVCTGAEALYALAGKQSPAFTAEEARAAAREAAALIPDTPDANNPGALNTNAASAHTPDTASTWKPFLTFLSETLTPEDAVRGIDAQAVRDLALLSQNSATGGITPRALSVSLYADSKRLETLLDIFSRPITRARRRNIPVPELSRLERAFPETLIAGKLVFEGTAPADAAPVILTNPSGSVIGLPLGTILKIRRVRLSENQPAGAPRALLIENLETFYAFAETAAAYAVVLYVGGHPNKAVRALTSLLAQAGFDLHHAGDLDPDGILILQELIRIAGKPITPLRMDAATFDRYAARGKKLEASVMRRLSLIREETIPGIAALIQKIEETGVGIEQEIIDYTPGLA
jgi:hypothetical protein